jgi:hypothetical protein
MVLAALSSFLVTRGISITTGLLFRWIELLNNVNEVYICV